MVKKPSQLMREWIEKGGDPAPMVQNWADMQISMWASKLLYIKEKHMLTHQLSKLPKHHQPAVLQRARKLKKLVRK